ncbi:transcription factor DYT1 [Cynara cardunculus var. scolymus]|uniref:transcription factor DYT1 n=1 Tax=Cynara cardunculus var. scolymus TaxID=59895 RepID=UPI000D62A5BC|nr:transcription factor DYT1 [Cynara cardunculus var. scolymus]
MEFSNLFDLQIPPPPPPVVEETHTSFERVICRNSRRQQYHDDDDQDDDDDTNHEGKFKSKNLKAERRRREKLKSRMLELRSLVPKITNLNKETIITDAIDYIKELQSSVTDLQNEIVEMEAEMAHEQPSEIIQVPSEEKMENWGIESDVEVTRIDENKSWMKIVFGKKAGGFTKLIEAMSVLGVELVDTSVTATKGALLVTSCIKGTQGKMLDSEQVQEVLVEIIKAI